MGKRFAIVIGVAAAGVMALGAQTAAAAPDVVKYDTTVTIVKDSGIVHGIVESKAWKCERRQVFLFKRRPGTDRKIDTRRTRPHRGEGHADWQVRDFRVGREAQLGDVLRAKVRREVHDEFVCRADRSLRLRWD